MQSAKWYGSNFKKTTHNKGWVLVKWLGHRVEAGAKQKAPIDTGALMSSIHTVDLKNEIAVKVGTNYEALKKAAELIGTETGTFVFYGRWQEKGWTMRNGVWHPGRHFLQGALDEIRMGFR